MDIGFERQGNNLESLSFSISSLIHPDPSRTPLNFGAVAGLFCPFPGSFLVQSANSWIHLTLLLVLAPRRLHLWLVGQTIQHPQITFLLFRGFTLSETRTEREDFTAKSKEDQIEGGFYGPDGLGLYWRYPHNCRCRVSRNGTRKGRSG